MRCQPVIETPWKNICPASTDAARRAALIYNIIIAIMGEMKDIIRKIFKKIRSVALIQWLIAFACYGAIKIVYWTSRVEIRNIEALQPFLGRAAVIVFWHGRSMMLAPAIGGFGFKGFAVMSKHADGKIMAKLQSLFGLSPIFGTSKKGGADVLRQGVGVLKKDKILFLSPDGPKGPRMRLADGCLYFAKMSGAPIIPICFSSTKAWVMNGRWDRYLIARPFGKIVCQVGDPVYFNRNNPSEMTDLHEKLEDIMVCQSQALDTEAGHPIIEQEPPRSAK